MPKFPPSIPSTSPLWTPTWSHDRRMIHALHPPPIMMLRYSWSRSKVWLTYLIRSREWSQVCSEIGLWSNIKIASNPTIVVPIVRYSMGRNFWSIIIEGSGQGLVVCDTNNPSLFWAFGVPYIGITSATPGFSVKVIVNGGPDADFPSHPLICGD